MKASLRYLIITLLIASTGVLTLNAQKRLTLIPAESKVTISGTSTLHDWEERVEKFEVSVSFLSPGAGELKIGDVKFISRSASIVSDNALMTSKTHDALGVDKYPEIIFRSSDNSVLEQNGKSFSGVVSGDLFLNGVTRSIEVPFTGVINNGTIEVRGSETIIMSDYNVKPPTAMLGTLKTGNKVTVAFLLHFRTE